MKAMTVAALLLQLSAAGGAGSAGERAGKRQASPEPKQDEDVGKQFSSLKSEISSLKAEFRAAKERQRQEAERKAREEEARYGEPTTPPAAPQGNANTGAGGAGAPAR